MRRYQDILLVTINPGLAIVGVVPPAMIGVAYSTTLTAFGGVEPYQWAIVGGAIPDDFTAEVDSNGDFVISGTESDVPDIGDYLFTVLLRDSSGKSTTKAFRLRVVAEPLVIVGDAPDAIFGVPYSYDYAITGGVPPYFPYLEIGGGYGPLPDGLTLTQPSTNVLRLEGTPTAGQLNVTFKIAANDSQWPAAYAFVVDTMSVVPDALIVTGTFLDTVIGSPLAGSPLAISGGIPPYSLSGSPYSGTRPAGVSIAVVGDEVVATGNTTTAASYSWTERVMDSFGDHYDVVSSMEVTIIPLVVTGTFTDSTLGAPLSGTPLPISGGDGSYGLSGSPYAGTRPPGVSFSVVGSDLVASGNTSTGGDYTWTERVTSGDGQHFDVVSHALVSNPVAVSIWNKLIAWYDFETTWAALPTPGTSVASFGPNLTTTVLASGDPNPVAGVVGNAAQRQASTSHRIYLPRSNPTFDFGDVDFSIAGWFRRDASRGGQNCIVGRHWAVTANRSYILQYIDSTGNLEWGVSGNGVATTLCTVAVNPLDTTGTWGFIAATHDSVANQIGVSINAGAYTNAAHSAGVYAASAANFSLGMRLINDTTDDSATIGNMSYDSLCVCSGVLSGTELTYLYNGAAGKSYSQLHQDAGSPP